MGCAWTAAVAYTAATPWDAEPVRPDFFRQTRRAGLRRPVAGLAQDRKGFVWVGTQGGLHRFDGQRYHLFRHDPRDPGSLPDSYVTALALEGDDALWVGTFSEFVARLDLRDGRIKRYA